MTHPQLLQRLREINSRGPGSLTDDRNDAIDALLDYINDKEVRELFERITDDEVPGR